MSVYSHKPPPADHAVAEIDQPQLVRLDPERADEEDGAPAERRDEAALARADGLHPLAEQRRRRAQHEDRDREDPAELGELPVARARVRDPELLRERQVEHAERVRLADAEVGRERARWNQPAVES